MSCNSDPISKTDRLKHFLFVVFLNNLKLRLLWMRKPFPEKQKIFPGFPVSLRVMCNDNIKAEFYHICYDPDIKLGCHLTMFTFFNSILCFVRIKEAGRWNKMDIARYVLWILLCRQLQPSTAVVSLISSEHVCFVFIPFAPFMLSGHGFIIMFHRPCCPFSVNDFLGFGNNKPAVSF